MFFKNLIILHNRVINSFLHHTFEILDLFHLKIILLLYLNFYLNLNRIYNFLFYLYKIKIVFLSFRQNFIFFINIFIHIIFIYNNLIHYQVNCQFSKFFKFLC